MLIFNYSTVKTTSVQKYLGLIVERKILFHGYVNDKINEAVAGLPLLQRHVKILAKSHLANNMYDQTSNTLFSNRMESVQYSTVFALAGTTKKLLMKSCGRS